MEATNIKDMETNTALGNRIAAESSINTHENAFSIKHVHEENMIMITDSPSLKWTKA